MMSSRLMIAAKSSVLVPVTKRGFSSNCAAANKLRDVFEEYRQENFSRETPKRFKKELLEAVAHGSGSVKVDELNSLLINIGRADKLLSEAELSSLLDEVGAKSRDISTSDMTDLLA